MSQTVRSKARSFLIATSWIPLTLWFGTRYSIRGYDGWGAWAAAPMLLPAVFLSIGLGLAGLIAVALDLVNGQRPDWLLIAATLLSASVILYLAIGAALR
jgi:hypothetical protein